MIKKYRYPLALFSSGLILFLLTFDGVMKIEKLNFLIEPYFIFWVLSLVLLTTSLFWFLMSFLKKLLT